jgi:uncharacterized Zn finger protein
MPSRRGFGSGWGGGGFPPPSRPRHVDGGLIARSVRGDIGEQWWSRRFIEVLESFALGSRLTRGRNYARRGQVISLDVQPGAAIAKVQGSRRAPYRVRIELSSYSELVWTKIEVALAEQAIYSAALLAGEMPAELEQVFADVGAPLFPRQANDLTMSCSCPDWEVPCKHLSAAFYLLAERFDDDPFQILHWRGRARDVLLARLRMLRDDAPSLPMRALSDGDEQAVLPNAGAATALSGMAAPAAETAIGFWSGQSLPLLPVAPPLPADLLLRQLPAPPALLGGQEFATELRLRYVVLGEHTPTPLT